MRRLNDQKMFFAVASSAAVAVGEDGVDNDGIVVVVVAAVLNCHRLRC